MAELKLEPCPFCGGVADLEEEDWAATCYGCGFSYSGEGFDSLEKLAAKWNRRPYPAAAIQAAREALSAVRAGAASQGCTRSGCDLAWDSERVPSHTPCCPVFYGKVVEAALALLAPTEKKP